MNFVLMRGGVVHLRLKDILWPNSRFISEGGGPIKLDMSWGLIFLTFLLAPYIKMFPTFLKIKGKLTMIVKDNDFIMDLWSNMVDLKDDLVYKFNEFKNNDKKPFLKYFLTAILYALIVYLIFGINNGTNEDDPKDVNKTEMNVPIPTDGVKEINKTEVNITIPTDGVKEVNKTEMNTSVPTVEKNVTVVESNISTVVGKEVNNTKTTVEANVAEAMKEIKQVTIVVPKKKHPKKHVVKRPVKRNTNTNSIKEDKKIKLSPRNNKKLINRLKRQYPKSTIDDIFKEFR